MSPVDCMIDELNVFQPDLSVFGDGPDDVPQDNDQYIGTPWVVVEALSPSTAARDRGFKVRRYLGLGVREIWLLDWRKQTIEVVDTDGSRLHEGRDEARSDALVSDAGVAFRIAPETLYARDPRQPKP